MLRSHVDVFMTSDLVVNKDNRRRVLTHFMFPGRIFSLTVLSLKYFHHNPDQLNVRRLHKGHSEFILTSTILPSRAA